MNDKITKSFYENGFAIIKGLFSQEEIAQLRVSCDIVEDAAKGVSETTLVNGTSLVVDKKNLLRAVWVGALEPYFLKIGRDKRILNPVANILASKKMDHLINQVHFKRPGDNVIFPLHQDSEHRRYTTDLWSDLNLKGSYVQTVLAIDHMTSENGPILVVKNSHKEGHLDLINNPDITLNIKQNQISEILLNSGDLLLFGPYLIHGSVLLGKFCRV